MSAPLEISHISPRERADLAAKDEKRRWQMSIPVAKQPAEVVRDCARIVQNRSQTPTLHIYGKSRLVRLHVPAVRKGGGIRGEASASKASRKRLIEKIHTIRRDQALPQLVTLTFPDWFPDTKQAKRWLDSLLKRVKRYAPHVAAIWRMEMMQRKSGENKGQVAPHFHLLVWGGLSREWLSKAWFEVCGESDYAHVKYGADVIELESWAATLYPAKDMVKPSNVPEDVHTGRVWGIHNRAALPTAGVTDSIEVSSRQAVVLQRTMRRLQRSRDVMSWKSLSKAAVHPCEKRPLHTAERARAALRRSRRHSRSRTVFSDCPAVWLAWLCTL